MADYTPEEHDLIVYFDSLGIDPGSNPNTGEPYPAFSDKEKLEMARSFKMQNNEFAHEIAGRGDEELHPYITDENIEKVRLVSNALPEWMEEKYGMDINRFGSAGEFVPTYQRAQKVEGLIRDNQIDFGGNSYQRMRKMSDRPIEEDSIILYGDSGISEDTATHEFMHLQHEEEGRRHDKEAHEEIYVRTAMSARNQEEFDDSVKGYMAWQNRDHGMTKEAAEEMLPYYRDRMFELIESYTQKRKDR